MVLLETVDALPPHQVSQRQGSSGSKETDAGQEAGEMLCQQEGLIRAGVPFSTLPSRERMGDSSLFLILSVLPGRTKGKP